MPVSEIGPQLYTCSPLCVVNPAPGITRKNISSMQSTPIPTTAATDVPTFSHVPSGTCRTAVAAWVQMSANSTMPTIISRYRRMYTNGNSRGFHSRPITGRLSRVRYTIAINAKQVMPIQAPLRLRFTTLLTNPMSAKPLTTMSQNGLRSKNMSQKLSPPPLGRKPYFMSVM